MIIVMSMFPGEQPAQTSPLASHHHVEWMRAGLLPKSVCRVAVIYTPIMIFMKRGETEHA